MSSLIYRCCVQTTTEMPDCLRLCFGKVNDCSSYYIQQVITQDVYLHYAAFGCMLSHLLAIFLL
jgi:hypothetical protein